MFKVVSVSQMQAIEKETDLEGISYDEMMENAGRCVALAVAKRIDLTGSKIVILVGPGNNGGDGLVSGRILAENGAKVTFYLFRTRPTNDNNYERALKMDLPFIVAADDPNAKILHEIVVSADVIIDALLGTGADRPIKGMMRVILDQCKQAIQKNRVNRRHNQKLVSPLGPSIGHDELPIIVAVDCPSGLNCDTGALDEAAFKASLTVTFDSPKIGQLIFPGASAIGDLVVADIGMPGGLKAHRDVELELATFDGVRDLLQAPPLNAHKGTMGKVMIAAGSINYTGAAALAGLGAYRAGAGLVTLAIPSSIHCPIASRLPEATFVLLPHDMGAINESASRVLCDAVKGFNVLLIGPGLGQDGKTRLFLSALLAGERQTDRGSIGFVHPGKYSSNQEKKSLPPLVLDADALNILAGLDNWPKMLPEHSILTPHPGEMARLMTCDLDSIENDRVQAAKKAARDWGQVVILKGAYSVVAEPEGRATIIPFANPALATAGSGDVLAGCIAALRASGISAYNAALAGAFIHAKAGQLAAESLSRTGVIAGDIALFITNVMAGMTG